MDPHSDEEMVRSLSPRTAEILWLFKQHGSIGRLRAAHPEITDQEVANVTMEVMRAYAMVEGAKETAEPAKRSKRTPAASGRAYQLKITLEGSRPPIWRRVVVPPDIMLDRLHAVIQVAMGWMDSHLHRFQMGSTIYMGRAPGEELLSDLGDQLDEAEYRLCDVMRRAKTKLRYSYDFGDNWKHSVLLEKVIAAHETSRTPVCIAGKNNCPPEDCGGIWGYYSKLEILQNPGHREHEHMVEWMGHFDPDKFDLDVVNRRLAKLTT